MGQKQMCISIVGRIVEVGGHAVVVDVAGQQRAVLLADGVQGKLDSYVLIHAGLAVSDLERAEAEEMISLLQKVASDG